MELNLRKAHAVQKAIGARIDSIQLRPVIELSEFDKPEDRIQLARSTLKAARDRKIALTKALFEIRTEVAKVNVTSGLAAALTQQSEIKALIAIERDLVDEEVVTADMSSIKARIEKMKAQDTASSDRYGTRRDVFDVGVMAAEERDAHGTELARLERLQRGLGDTLLGLNLSNTITLSKACADLLTREEIL